MTRAVPPWRLVGGQDFDERAALARAGERLRDFARESSSYSPFGQVVGSMLGVVGSTLTWQAVADAGLASLLPRARVYESIPPDDGGFWSTRELLELLADRDEAHELRRAARRALRERMRRDPRCGARVNRGPRPPPGAAGGAP